MDATRDGEIRDISKRELMDQPLPYNRFDGWAEKGQFETNPTGMALSAKCGGGRSQSGPQFASIGRRGAGTNREHRRLP